MTGREASIRTRLKAVAVQRGITFQYATLLYMHEGFLRRLSASLYKDRFILKGGLLLQCLSGSLSRTTKDIDFLGREIEDDVSAIKTIVAAICKIYEDDALRFDPDSLFAEAIMKANACHGVRISALCYLGNICNVIKIDVGFGDALGAPAQEIAYPILVDGREFSILSYPLTSVIAEKFEAMVSLADINSRMKDFWDIAYMLEHYAISDEELLEALRATFKRRKTVVPITPSVFSSSFANSAEMHTRWQAFLKRSKLPSREWIEVLSIIKAKLEPLAQRLCD